MYRMLAFVFVLTILASQDRMRAGEQDAPEDKFAHLIGKKAPDLVSHWSLSGQPVKLSDLRGKVVLIDFWAVWCGPCIRTFPLLREWSKTYKDDGFEVLGVTTYQKFYRFDKEEKKLKFVGEKFKDEDTGKFKAKGGLTEEEEHETLRDFTRHHKLKHRVITLTREDYVKSAQDYSRKSIPHAVLVDRLGIVRMVKVGASDASLEALEAEIKKLVAEK